MKGKFRGGFGVSTRQPRERIQLPTRTVRCLSTCRRKGGQARLVTDRSSMYPLPPFLVRNACLYPQFITAPQEASTAQSILLPQSLTLLGISKLAFGDQVIVVLAELAR